MAAGEVVSGRILDQPGMERHQDLLPLDGAGAQCEGSWEPKMAVGCLSPVRRCAGALK